MDKNKKRILFSAIVIGLLLLATQFYAWHPMVLNPAGEIAEKQRNLIIFAALLSLVVVIPVYVLTVSIAWNYREGNKKSRYRPDWDGDRRLETIWWTVPGILIIILSVVTWNSTRDLDPFKPLASSNKTMTVQVVALEWKWLFIYPDQNIASVNSVHLPTDTPVRFEITADAPMNSFWIPRLGGQIYAMSGMSTQLNLIANKPGVYYGSSANLSGRGFAGMNFTATAESDNEFAVWVKEVKQSPDQVTFSAYSKLAKPSQNNRPAYYSGFEPDLFDTVMNKYMPEGHHAHQVAQDTKTEPAL